MMRKRITLMIGVICCMGILGGCKANLFGKISCKYDNSDKYTMGGAALTGTVESIEIEWIDGSITIASHDDDTVEFGENSKKDLDSDSTMYYWLDGTTLHLKYCRSGNWKFNNLDKELTVYIPKDLVSLKDVEINGVSSEITMESFDTEIDNLAINSVSGKVSVEDIDITEAAEINTTSGKVDVGFTGSMTELNINTVSGAVEVSVGETDDAEINTTSGKVKFVTDSVPDTLEINTISGKVELYVSESSDFSLEYSTVSGSFSSDIDYSRKNDKYIYGDGTNKVEVNTTSGSAKVYTK